MKTLLGIARICVLAGAWFAAAPAGANDWSTLDYDLYRADFDGDGRDDLLYVAKSPDQASGIALSDGSGPNTAHQTFPGNHLGITWHGNHYLPIIGDYNGDGHDDVFLQRQTPGDHYLILTQASTGQLVAIAQTIPNNHLGLDWSADAHRIVAGRFNGDARTDLLLQGTSPTSTHAIVAADSAGQFTAAPAQTWTENYLGFKWWTSGSILQIGDFDGDGRDDLFLQGRPGFAIVDPEAGTPVPAYRAGSYAVLLAKSSGAIFQLSSILQTWDHKHLGAEWSPLFSNVLVGDFNGDGKDDLLLQGRTSVLPSYWLPADAAAQFTSLNGLATNQTWYASRHRMVVANFDGGSVTGLYLQRQVENAENNIAHVITGATVTFTTHAEENLARATPGTAVGAIAGQFSVDESGGANYRIPIQTPPGVAGMTPELALGYSLRGGNGLVGVRWSLAGLSAVTRCGAGWEQDGATDGIDYDALDRLCLDGQRLLPVSGTYGNTGIEYRTELQSFQKVVSVGGTNGDPGSFTVWTKSGQVLEYGTSADSRIEGQGRSEALVWALRRVRDRYDNFIEYVSSVPTLVE